MAKTLATSASKGLILILIGLIAFFLPIFTAFSITTVLGILLIISGVLYVVSALAHRDSSYFVSQLVLGIVGVLIGILFLTHGLTILSIVLGIWFVLFALAMFHKAFSFMSSRVSMALMIITGILALFFALVLFSGWPFSGLAFIGEMAGIIFVLQGISLLCKAKA
jgi:uncharacterized membrane protein HdeD (DUF308 family)